MVLPQSQNPPIQKAQQILKSLKNLPKTPKMPVLFIGHGSPMNAIENNQFTKSWRELGQNLTRPNIIVVMSAHWVTTKGSFITAMPKPPIIHDFYGFPEELYAQKYPAPGNPEVAAQIQDAVCEIKLDHEWGLDHGAWSILNQMYPKAHIPVLQLSINYSLNPLQEFELLQQLQFLREHGVLFIGSGNIVHNLGRINFENAPHDWALEFDTISKALIENRDTVSLSKYQNLGNAAKMSIPTDEHYRPMLGALALTNSKDNLSFFNEEVVMGSVGMRSFILQ